MLAGFTTIGFVIGVVLGLTGAGGSVMAVPLLIVVLGLEPAAATGLALGVVATSSAYGALQRIRHREVLWIPALLFGAGGVVLAPVGRLWSLQLDPHVLLAGFAVLSIVIAARMFWQSVRQPEQTREVRAAPGDDNAAQPLLCRFSDSGHFDWRWRCMAGLSVGGILTGLVSGLFGVGGGFLIVPFLNQLNNVSMRQAVATSLVIIAGISGSGFVTHLLTQAVSLTQLLWLAAGGIGGMAMGSVLARKIAGAHLQRVFALTIIVMSLMVFVRG